MRQGDEKVGGREGGLSEKAKNVLWKEGRDEK